MEKLKSLLSISQSHQGSSHVTEPLYSNSLYLEYSFSNSLQEDYADLLSHGLNVMFLEEPSLITLSKIPPQPHTHISHSLFQFPIYFLHSIYQNVKYLWLCVSLFLYCLLFLNVRSMLSESFSDWFLTVRLEYFNKCVLKEFMDLWEIFVGELGFIWKFVSTTVNSLSLVFFYVSHPFSALNLNKGSTIAHKHFWSTDIWIPVIALRAKDVRMTVHDLKQPIA